MSRGFKLSVFLIVVTVFCGAATAEAAPGELVTPSAGPTGVEWRPLALEMGLVLTVAGPQDLYLRQEYAPGETASFSVFDEAGGLRPAGSYVWEIYGVPQLDEGTRAELQALRESGGDGASLQAKAGKLPAGGVVSGAFAIADGAILMGGETEPRPGKPAGSGGNVLAPRATVLTNADGVIRNSLCVGFDCGNSETFGFDTIRLKENNTRIQFDDTSAGSFPTNNWQIRANSNASGGANFMAFVDQGATGNSESGTIVFQVTAGAPANSLLVASNGKVGLRTASPVLDLHIRTNDSPAIRLEQASAGGFTAQTWDIAGNEANFFVRDVTGGSRLPFRIRPNAPTSSIDIADSGNVGIGTASPGNPLHVSRNTTSFLAALNLQNAGGDVGFRLTNDLDVIDLNLIEAGGLNELRINLGASPPELALTASGNMTITGNYFSATCTAPGSPCAPDYVFAPDYELMPLNDLRTFVQENRHLPNVPSESELREAGQINLSTFQLTLLEKVEELTLYTLDQDEHIKQLRELVSTKEETIGALEERLDRLEAAAVVER